jgi:thioester reductase-like protein
VSSFLNSANHLESNKEQSRDDITKELTQKSTQQLREISITVNRSKGPSTVALVGSTGYLGPQILASLMVDSDIASIHCLNRSLDAKERTENELKIIENHTKVEFDHVKFLVVEIGTPRLGLHESDFVKLSQEVNTIVYNAWRPNFSLPISSFCKSFLSGLRNIID